MWNKNQIKSGSYKQETKAGVLGIEVEKDGTIFMNQNLPKFFEELDKPEIADSLDIPVDYIDRALPVQIVSTGLKDIFVPITSIARLYKIKPNSKKISAINKQTTTVGYHVFTLETKFGSTAHCRNFAPLYGIPEESATGTSNGALSCYLFKHGKIINPQLSRLVFEQGYSMNKPSEILAKLIVSDDRVDEVKVGGRAIISKELKIEI